MGHVGPLNSRIGPQTGRIRAIRTLRLPRGPNEKDRETGVGYHGWPQQNPGLAADPDESEIQRDGRAVGQHADPRWTRPAGDPEREKGDAGHARDGYGDADKLLAEQQPPDDRWNNQQRYASRGFAQSGENKHPLHRAGNTRRNTATSATTPATL